MFCGGSATPELDVGDASVRSQVVQACSAFSTTGIANLPKDLYANKFNLHLSFCLEGFNQKAVSSVPMRTRLSNSNCPPVDCCGHCLADTAQRKQQLTVSKAEEKQAFEKIRKAIVLYFNGFYLGLSRDARLPVFYML